MKCFLFDIGNVLADFDDRDLLEAVSSSTSHPREEATAREPELDDLVEKGLIGDEEYLARLNASKGLEWTIDDLTSVWSKVFTLNHVGWSLYKEAVQAGIPVYLLSNIAPFHINAILSNWPDFFKGAKGLFLSYQIGARKPHPEIYRYVLRDLELDGTQCFFVDDLQDNVETAQSLGLHAHQFIPENHVMIREAVREFFGG